MPENCHPFSAWLVHNHLSLYPLCCTDAKDSENLSPLHDSCYRGHLDVVEYLVSNTDCDISKLTMNGYVYRVVLDVMPKAVRQSQLCLPNSTSSTSPHSQMDCTIV